MARPQDGGRFWASVITDPIRSPSGDLVGYAKIKQVAPAARPDLEIH